MDLKSVVKYANAAYAGLMVGLAAYFIILIKHGYTFVPSSSISVDQLFASGTLGPLMLGIIPWIIVVMIIATVFIVLINMIYENSIRPRKEEKEVVRRKEERRSKGKK